MAQLRDVQAAAEITSAPTTKPTAKFLTSPSPGGSPGSRMKEWPRGGVHSRKALRYSRAQSQRRRSCRTPERRRKRSRVTIVASAADQLKRPHGGSPGSRGQETHAPL